MGVRLRQFSACLVVSERQSSDWERSNEHDTAYKFGRAGNV